MTLPLNAQHLISAYSKPRTRPDWRTIHPVNFADLYCHILSNWTRSPLFNTVYKNIHSNNTLGTILYITAETPDITECSALLSIPENILKNIKHYFQPFIDDDEQFVYTYRY